MAGNSNSGRKPMLSDRTVEEILSLGSTILLKWLSNPEVSDTVKIPVIAQFINKRIPATTILEGEVRGGDKVVVYIKEKEVIDKDKCNTGRLPAQVFVEPS